MRFNLYSFSLQKCTLNKNVKTTSTTHKVEGFPPKVVVLPLTKNLDPSTLMLNTQEVEK